MMLFKHLAFVYYNHFSAQWWCTMWTIYVLTRKFPLPFSVFLFKISFCFGAKYTNWRWHRRSLLKCKTNTFPDRCQFTYAHLQSGERHQRFWLIACCSWWWFFEKNPGQCVWFSRFDLLWLNCSSILKYIYSFFLSVQPQ